MKKFAVMIAAVLVLAGAGATLAEEKAAKASPWNPVKVSGDVYVGMFDKYLWRGFDLSGSTAVTQGGMDLSFNNFTLSYWTNVQMKDQTQSGTFYQGGDANETDLTLNYAFDLGKVSLNVGDIYYTLDGLNDTNELYLGATLNTLLSPTFKVYYDWDEFQDDRFYTLSIGHSLDVGKVSISGGALASYSQADYSNTLWNAELSLKATVPVTEQVSVSPSILYSAPLSDDAQVAIDTEIATGLTVTLAF